MGFSTFEGAKEGQLLLSLSQILFYFPPTMHKYQIIQKKPTHEKMHIIKLILLISFGFSMLQCLVIPSKCLIMAQSSHDTLKTKQ
jgi:hypothetical protein